MSKSPCLKDEHVCMQTMQVIIDGYTLAYMTNYFRSCDAISSIAIFEMCVVRLLVYNNEKIGFFNFVQYKS